MGNIQPCAKSVMRCHLTCGTHKGVLKMSLTIEQISEEALALPTEARALLADRLVESLDPLEDATIRQLWANEARVRRDDVRNGVVKTIPGEEALDRVRKSVTR
jgi:hypothetical protein